MGIIVNKSLQLSSCESISRKNNNQFFFCISLVPHRLCAPCGPYAHFLMIVCEPASELANSLPRFMFWSFIASAISLSIVYLKARKDKRHCMFVPAHNSTEIRVAFEHSFGCVNASLMRSNRADASTNSCEGATRNDVPTLARCTATAARLTGQPIADSIYIFHSTL
jgi:hypothetical protein